jgi:hypothetical protein
VAALKSSGQSLMPEGLEKTISVPEMADLLAFLKNWRYLDGGVPLGSADSPGANATPLAGIKVEEHADHIFIETDMLQARINKTGYVSGIAAGSFLDKKTGARDLGFGLHIMDFLLAPGWREDGYTRDPKLHGNLSKHYVEGPQICTKARKLEPEVIRGKDFVAVRLRFTFTEAGKGYQPGSEWVQTLLFLPSVRHCLTSEEITSKNTVDNLFYRIDMPGHIKHQKGSEISKVYLSYHGEIEPSAFASDFGPDQKFLYQRKDKVLPKRLIRAYQMKMDGKPGPWLAGMTLDPAACSEAWCHQRGYVCMIQELHQRRVKAGEKFGAAYVIGWFDSTNEMEAIYDRFRGKRRIVLEPEAYHLD